MAMDGSRATSEVSSQQLATGFAFTVRPIIMAMGVQHSVDLGVTNLATIIAHKRAKSCATMAGAGQIVIGPAVGLVVTSCTATAINNPTLVSVVQVGLASAATSA